LETQNSKAFSISSLYLKNFFKQSDMKKIFLIFVLGGLLALGGFQGYSQNAGGEARLLRFPSTNGREVVFSYAGDLFTAPLSGGEAHRLTSHVGYEMFARYSLTERRLRLPGNMTETVRSTSFLPKAGSQCD
jgi:tricorn protease-like protein